MIGAEVLPTMAEAARGRGASSPASSRLWAAAAALVVLQLGLGAVAWNRLQREHTVYVFTPMVDVVPGGAPLSGVEADALAAGVQRQVDARDMQVAYARLGSTLSLDDLLRGVEGLDAAGAPLTEAQKQRVAAILDAARADHDAVRRVQGEILDLEAELSRETKGALDALPPEVRAEVVRASDGRASDGRALDGRVPR